MSAATPTPRWTSGPRVSAPWLAGGELARPARGPAGPNRAGGRDVYVYFDNDVKVRAPFDAMGLARRVGLQWQAGIPAPSAESITDEARSSWPAVANPLARRACDDSSHAS